MSYTGLPISTWTNARIIELINAMKNCPAMWDINSDDYKDKVFKNEELRRLAREFNSTEFEINRKIKSLKTQFTREHKKIMVMQVLGKSIPRSKWFGYEHLKFLLQCNINDSRIISSQTQPTCSSNTLEVLINLFKYVFASRLLNRL